MNTTAPHVGHLDVPRPQIPRWFSAIGGPLVALVCAAALTSCTPVQAYVQADRAIYDAVAPAHRAYVTADPALSGEQKDRRFRTLEEWRKLVETAELGQAPATRPSR